VKKKLSKNFIISKFPKDFKYSYHNGLPLDSGWYCLIYDDITKQWILRTATNEPCIEEIRQYFTVTYKDNFWGHWSDFVITEINDNKS